MMINKKGLSTVVTTLIIVLLTLAAIGIIWGPISDLLSKGEGAIDKTKCLDVDIRATKVVNANELGVEPMTYNVTLQRSAAGEGSFGVKLIFFDAAGNPGAVETPSEFFAPLQPKTIGPITGIVNATKVEITPYYIDTDGKEKLCDIKSTYEFQL